MTVFKRWKVAIGKLFDKDFDYGIVIFLGSLEVIIKFPFFILFLILFPFIYFIFQANYFLNFILFYKGVFVKKAPLEDDASLQKILNDLKDYKENTSLGFGEKGRINIAIKIIEKEINKRKCNDEEFRN